MTLYVDTPLRKPNPDMLRNNATGDIFIFKDALAGEAEQLDALLKADILFYYSFARIFSHLNNVVISK